MIVTHLYKSHIFSWGMNDREMYNKARMIHDDRKGPRPVHYKASNMAHRAARDATQWACDSYRKAHSAGDCGLYSASDILEAATLMLKCEDFT